MQSNFHVYKNQAFDDPSKDTSYISKHFASSFVLSISAFDYFLNF